MVFPSRLIPSNRVSKKYLPLIASRESSITSIPMKCMGLPLVLGDFDQQVQQYIKTLRAAGTAISSHLVHVVAAAQGIIEAKDGTLLVENGGSIHLTRSWANSLKHRMGVCEVSCYYSS